MDEVGAVNGVHLTVQLRDLRPFHDLRSAHRGWESLGDDPQFVTECRLPEGWHKLTLRMNHSDIARAQIYLNTGSGFNAEECHELGSFWRGGPCQHYFHTDKPINAIRFDPLDKPGKFELSEFTLEPVAETCSVDMTATTWTPAHDVVQNGPDGDWESTGTDPQFISHCQIFPGRASLRLRIKFGQRIMSDLFLDTGKGFNSDERIPLGSFYGDVDIERWITVDKRVLAVRFDPGDKPFKFTVHEFIFGNLHIPCDSPIAADAFHPASQLKRGTKDGEWHATGDDPQFVALREFSTGWVRIKLRMICESGGIAKLHLDTGAGFNQDEIHEVGLFGRDTTIEKQYYFRRPVKALRLDPVDRRGRIEIKELQICHLCDNELNPKINIELASLLEFTQFEREDGFHKTILELTAEEIGTGRIATMIEMLKGAPKLVLPSKYWTDLNNTKLRQLEIFGYENFKQTITLNYFTCIGTEGDPQLTFLKWNLIPDKIEECKQLAKSFPINTLLNTDQSLYYKELAFLLWEYLSQIDTFGFRHQLEEPAEGGAPEVLLNGRAISPDLANSILEFISIYRSFGNPNDVKSIWELGAGYGRTAFVFLKLMPGIKYVVVDVPPDLYIAERYLSALFPDKRIFRFRKFDDFDAVRDEFNQADIAFLLPNQLEVMGRKSIDLFLNISSLHQMRHEQVAYYMNAINRITRNFVYLKQWKMFKNIIDGVTINEANYPVPASWRQVFWRECPVQTSHFEALYRL